MRSLSVNLWRGAGVLATMLIAVILVVAIIHFNSSHRVIAQQPPPAIVPVDISAGTTVTVPALFQTLAIAAGGGTMIGVSHTADATGSYQSAAIERYTVATQKIDRLYTFANAQQFFGDIATDGRYIAWVTSTAADNATSITLRLMGMDLQTLHATTIVAKTEAHGNLGDYQLAVQHGYVFWQDMTATNTSTPYNGVTTGALKMANLATGAVTTLATTLTLLTSTSSDFVAFHVSWPYVDFTTAGARETPCVIDVTTGGVRYLPGAPVVAATGYTAISYTLVGTTLLSSWLPGDGSREFAELDITNRENSWQDLATVTQSFSFHDSTFQANDRLLLFSGQVLSDINDAVTLAWDRHLHQLFRLSTRRLTDSSSSSAAPLANFTNADLLGDWLVLGTFSADLTTTTLTVFPTTLALPHS